jgi:hypothetical protein
LDLLLKTQQTQTLRTIFVKSKMLNRLIESFDDKDLRGIIILICESVRIAASKEDRNGYLTQLLESTESWASFAERLGVEARRQATPIVVFPARS